MKGLLPLDIYHSIPFLIDNLSTIQLPEIFPRSSDVDEQNQTHLNYPKSNHLLYFVDPNLNNDQNASVFKKFYGSIDSLHDPEFNCLDLHLETPSASGFWIINPSTTNTTSGIHWRILSDSRVLELRIINFTSQNISLEKDTNKNDFGPNTEISPLFSFVFSAPIHGIIDFFSTTSGPDPSSVFVFVISSLGFVYRLDISKFFLSASNRNYPSTIRHMVRSFKSNFLTKKFESEDKVKSDPQSVILLNVKKENQVYDSYRVKAVDSDQVLVYNSDGFIYLLSGFSKSPFNAKKVFEVKIDILSQDQRPMLSFLNPFSRNSENFLRTIHVRQPEFTNLNTTLKSPITTVFGLESSNTLWLWNLDSKGQKQKITLNLPNFSDSNSIKDSCNNSGFVVPVSNYHNIFDKVSTHEIDNEIQREYIALVVYVPDNHLGYFSIAEGYIDHANFKNSFLKMTSMKRLSDIFPELRPTSLIDLKVLNCHTELSSNIFRWKLVSLWSEGPTESVSYCYLEVSSNSIEYLLSSDSNSSSSVPSLIKWGSSQTIGEMWVPMYDNPANLHPQHFGTEFQLLNEWITEKKKDPLATNMRFDCFEHDLEFENSEYLRDKVNFKICSTFLGYILDPTRYSSSVVKNTIEFYIRKHELKTCLEDPDFRSLSLRSLLTKSIYQKLSNEDLYTENEVDILASENENNSMLNKDQSSVFMFASRLFCEWAWLLNSITKVELDNRVSNSLFVVPDLDLVGVSKSLSFDLLFPGSDLSWVATQIENNSIKSKQHSGEVNMIRQNKLDFDDNFISLLSTKSLLPFLDKSNYSLLNSVYMSDIHMIIKSLSILRSKISSASLTVLSHKIKLLLKEFDFENFQTGLNNIFRDVYVTDLEIHPPILIEVISLVSKINNLDIGILQILDCLESNILACNRDPPLNLGESDGNTGVSPISNIYSISSFIASGELTILINYGFSIISSIMTLFGALAFVINEYGNEFSSTDSSDESSPNWIKLRNQKLISITKINQLFDSRFNNNVLQRCIHLFSYYSSLIDLSSSTTLATSASNKNLPVDQFVQSIDPSQTLSDTIQFQTNQFNIDSNTLSFANRIKGFYSKTHLTHFVFSFLHYLIYKWQIKACSSSKHWDKNPTSYTIFGSAKYIIQAFLSQEIFVSYGRNILTQPKKSSIKNNSSSGQINFLLDLPYITKQYLDYNIDSELAVCNLSHLPDTFDVNLICGISLIQIHNFNEASKRLVSAGNVVFIPNEVKLNPNSQLRLSNSDFYFLKNAWSEKLGLGKLSPSQYYLVFGDLFEKYHAYVSALAFYSAATDSLSSDLKKEKDVNISSPNSTLNLNTNNVLNSEPGCIALDRVSVLYTRMFDMSIRCNDVEKAYMCIIENPSTYRKKADLAKLIDFCLDGNDENLYTVLVLSEMQQFYRR
ncbi:hypothetical protein BB560_001493 [Smittium megazygosporum]|uniref:Nucleoporin nup120-like HEAT repeat domain-containing protein n=1 Tax=Smittium megazygosporum TaxID=133381 RepID=A0A2T9ZHC8_9FUNG|nr:hypothetical protein BB560_001493 [Smittium megazygosporum]